MSWSIKLNSEDCPFRPSHEPKRCLHRQNKTTEVKGDILKKAGYHSRKNCPIMAKEDEEVPF